MGGEPRHVAVIGAGISGIAAAHVLQKNGLAPVVFEKGAEPGGVWALAYPEVRLQNMAPHYHLSDFPWPFAPDAHPTGAQIRRYLRAAIDALGLDVRLRHEIVAAEEQATGWLVRWRAPDGEGETRFDYVVVWVGQYTDAKRRPRLPGEDTFRGDVLTERDVASLDALDSRRVVVVGFGKSAVDMATFAAARARSVHHVFRTPRWLIPEQILGVHFTWALFNRFGTVMMPSWAHPTAAERFLHRRMGGAVAGFWAMVERVLRRQVLAHAPRGDAEALRRLAAVQPTHRLVPDLRSAAALAPARYYEYVASGRIEPRRAAVTGFAPDGVRLDDGAGGAATVGADLVLLCVGSEAPAFPFLPAKYRALLEGEHDGAQLYRHLVHPRIPRLGFAGFNHGFMHVPAVEVGTLWLCAVLRGELALPGVEEMERSIEHVRAWKREHIAFEASRSCAVSTRFQQYLDVLLRDLGVSPYRKLPNVVAEVFGRYEAGDYRGVHEEYARATARRTGAPPRRPLPVHT
jgi:cation diffusion facilitator CzcD-associated flavoprotein CzcO